MKRRRTARTIVVWIALLLLIASWFYTYSNPISGYGASDPVMQTFSVAPRGYDWAGLFFFDLSIIALAAGFLFIFRGGNDS
jgi:hypothetical protein